MLRKFSNILKKEVHDGKFQIVLLQIYSPPTKNGQLHYLVLKSMDVLNRNTELKVELFESTYN